MLHLLSTSRTWGFFCLFVFCKCSLGYSVTTRGDLFSISQGCRKNPPKVFRTLPSTSLLSTSEPLQAWLQCTVKYSMEIPSWYICKALLKKEQKITRSESNLATSDTTVPDLVSSFLYHYSLFAQRLCWDCSVSGSEATMNTITPRYVSHFTAQCRHANSLPQPWNPTCNPTCKAGTMIWPIKYKDVESNAFWQFPYSSV